MKAIIPRSALAQALGIVKNAATRKAELPILANVRLETLEKSLRLTCSDLGLTLTTLVDADVKAQGDTTVPVATLHELVRSFSGDTVTLDHSAKKTINISAGKSTYDLGVIDPEEFPPNLALKDAATFKLPQDVFRQLLESTAYPAATAPAERAEFHGSFVSVNKEITVVACDGKRLAEATAAVTDGEKLTAIIPKRAVTELLRLLSDQEDAPQFTATCAENGLRFKFGDITLTTKTIAGTYPEYQKIIPKLEDGVVISRTDLLGALRRVGLLCEKAVLEFEGQMLTVSGKSTNKALPGKAEECLLIPPVKNKVRTAFNTAFLIEALTATTDDELTFFGVSDRPCVFQSQDGHWLGLTAAVKDKDEEPKPAEKTDKKPEPKAKK